MLTRALRATNWEAVAGILLAVALASCVSLAQMPKLDPGKIVARVNGSTITEIDIQNEIEMLYPMGGAHGGLRADKMQELRTKAIDELVVQELAYQRALKNGTAVPRAEMLVEYRRIRTKFGAQAFNDSLKNSGLTLAKYQRELQRRMTIQRLFERKVARPSRYSEAALLAYYRQNKQKFQRPEQVHARLFLASIEKNAKPEQERAAKDKVDMVYAELKAGKDFGLLAEQYSDDFYKVKGGDLGWTHRGRLEPVFEKVAFNLPVGKFSEPFRTEYGYNLMKVEGKEAAKQMTFADVKAGLKRDLEAEKMAELRSALVAELRKGATVEILDPTGPLPATAPSKSASGMAPIASH
jgi:parvulin-like peptidyl-prolyl isomerase